MNFQLERLIPKQVPWFSKRLIDEHLLRYQFTRRFIAGKVVLDLGCGVGYGCLEMAKSGAKKVVGIDVSYEAIKYAKRHYSHPKVRYIVADAIKTGLVKASFDTVVCFETLEHVADVTGLVTEAQRLLKDEGIFIVSTPNRETSLVDNPFHKKEYTLEELQRLLSCFSKVEWYGQRMVNLKIIEFYKKISKIVPSFLRILLHFRPWERLEIRKLRSTNDTSFLYFICISKK